MSNLSSAFDFDVSRNTLPSNERFVYLMYNRQNMVNTGISKPD